MRTACWFRGRSPPECGRLRRAACAERVRPGARIRQDPASVQEHRSFVMKNTITALRLWKLDRSRLSLAGLGVGNV